MAYQKQTVLTGDLITADWGNHIQTQYEEALVDVNVLTKVKSNRDSNGVYTQVDYKRPDGTLFMRSVLSGGTSPCYTTRTETYYGSDGSTVIKTVTYILTYAADGTLEKEEIAS